MKQESKLFFWAAFCFLIAFTPFAQSSAAGQSFAAEVGIDAGTKLADETQTKTGSFGKVVQKQCESPENAFGKLTCLKKIIEEKKSGVLVFVGESELETQSARVALENRELLYVAAILQAKTHLAQFHRVQVKARDERKKTIGKKGKDDVDVKKKELIQRRQQVMSEISVIMQDMENVEGRRKLTKLDRAEGPGLYDRVVALMDGTIKRIDPSYNPEKLGSSRNQNLSRRDKQYMELLAEYRETINRLKQEEASISSRQDTLESGYRQQFERLTTYSTEQVLVGATVLESAEYFNPEKNRYEVAVMIAWSENLQRRAEAVLTGNILPEYAISIPLTIQQYIGRLNIGGMLGGRWVITNDGIPWFVGFGMSAASNDSVENELSRDEARSDAIANLAFMLYSRTKANSRILKRVSIRSGSTTNFKQQASMARSETEVDIPVKTLAEVIRTRHPYLGRDVNIVIVGINAVHNARVKEFLLKQNKAIINVITSQKYRRGFIDRLKQIREEKKSDSSSYRKGARDAEKGMQKLKQPYRQPQQPSGGSRKEGISLGGGLNTKGL